MKSKNLGITKACPECKRTIIKSVSFTGNGIFNTKCPHCKSLIQVTITTKSILSLVKALVIFSFITLAISFGLLIRSTGQEIAQIIYNN